MILIHYPTDTTLPRAPDSLGGPRERRGRRNKEMKMPRKLLLSVGDELPMRGLRPGIVVRVTALCGRYVVTDLPAANGGTVELLTTEAMEIAGLPLWPRAEDVLDEPGILRGSRLHPEKRAWV